MSTITCHDWDQFMLAIESCVSRGLIFKADATLLQITLTGAF
jgi:hypothetical protein